LHRKRHFGVDAFPTCAPGGGTPSALFQKENRARKIGPARHLVRAWRGSTRQGTGGLSSWPVSPGRDGQSSTCTGNAILGPQLHPCTQLGGKPPQHYFKTKSGCPIPPRPATFTHEHPHRRAQNRSAP
jgi:hypothetical protein